MRPAGFLRSLLTDGVIAGVGAVVVFLPLILIFVIMYFLMIRPQMKRAKEHKAMVSGLSVSDEVIVGGGIANIGRFFDELLTR